MKRAIFFLSLLLTVGAVKAQTALVPFEWVKGCVFVDATVDSITGKYFVDTGAPMSLLHSRAQKSNYQEIGRIPIIDVFGNKTEGIPVVVINSLEMGQFRMPPGGLQVLVMNEGDPTEVMGIDGIVGCNFLSRMVVRFDSQQSMITFSGSVEPYGLTEEDGIPMRVEPAGHVYVEADLGNGIVEEAMFDTGSSNFFSLGHDAYGRLSELGVIDSVATIYGSGSVGASGISGASKGTNRVKIGEFNLGYGKFVDVTSDVLQGGPNSLLGAKLLKHGIVTLDYPHKRFYFEPYNDEPTNAYEAEWDVMIMSIGGQLRVATVWSDVDRNVEPGDEVVSVDGIGYSGPEIEEFLRLQREGDNTERQIVIRKPDGAEYTVISRKR